MRKRALISVYDKTGILDFAKFLVSKGIEIISTGGTYKYLKENNIEILEIQELNENTGNELFISTNSLAKKIKNITVAIEEGYDLGRLFDIDVIDINFEKLSRKSFRKCLICEEQAQECGRSRKHSVEELQNKIEEILKKSLVIFL